MGDSTARQQAVSLCCLLHAGLAAAGSPYFVEVTRNEAFQRFACQVIRREVAPGAHNSLATIRFTRSNRGDNLNNKRPMERTPVLQQSLVRVIASAPDVLLVHLGAFTFQDGCGNRQSLHDSLCNGTRPWLLHEYAMQWTLIAGALNEAYPPRQRRRSLVMLRTASPRDFEAGKPRFSMCARMSPLPEAELEEQEQRVDLSGMRASVLTKNLIMDAVAVHRMPWVRILDAYQISRARVDAHPGRFVRCP